MAMLNSQMLCFIWLVVWDLFYFSINWEEPSQLMFSRGIETTNQFYIPNRWRASWSYEFPTRSWYQELSQHLLTHGLDGLDGLDGLQAKVRRAPSCVRWRSVRKPGDDLSGAAVNYGLLWGSGALGSWGKQGGKYRHHNFQVAASHWLDVALAEFW